jgi:mannose/fructose-specific phosphotransferase system component IIA
MSEPLRAVVVSHGALAQALVDAVAHITGLADGLVAVTNEGCDREALERRVAQAVGEAPAVVFVDLPSGSCLLASARYLRTHPGVAVVAGVNLPMLVDFVYHREVAPLAAAERAVATGARALKVVAG